MLAAGSLLPAALGAQSRWMLKEDLRIGSLDEGPAQFSDIRGLAVGPKGDIYVLEYKTQDIRVFDAAGMFVRRIGRTGSGPGEMRMANGMVMAPDGRLWVNDPGNSRFTVFDGDGHLSATHVLSIRGYGYLWNAMVDTAGMVYGEVFVPAAPGQPNTFIRRLRPNGTVSDTIPFPGCGRKRATEEMVFQASAAGRSTVADVPFVARQAMVWDPRGFLWCSPADVFDVVQLRLGRGDTIRRVTRDVQPLSVTSAERDAAIARVKEQFKRFQGVELDFSRIPKVKPVISALDLDDRGDLWVRRTVADTLKAAFDVIDRSGKHIAVAEAPWRLAPFYHLVFRGDNVYGITRDDDGVPYVVRAKIGRS